MNPAKSRPGEVVALGDYGYIILAVDSHHRQPVQKEFFDSRQVGPEDKKKMHAALTNFARTGPTPNRERYELINGCHYIKIHAFRAFCLERRDNKGRRQIVVCHIAPKKSDSALADTHSAKALRRYREHCERDRP